MGTFCLSDSITWSLSSSPSQEAVELSHRLTVHSSPLICQVVEEKLILVIGIVLYLSLNMDLTNKGGDKFSSMSKPRHLLTLRTPCKIEQLTYLQLRIRCKTPQKFVRINRISTYLGCLNLHRCFLPLATLLVSWIGRNGIALPLTTRSLLSSIFFPTPLCPWSGLAGPSTAVYRKTILSQTAG